MKQHISMEQINELSEKGKKALLTWWKPKVGDLCTDLDLELKSIVLDINDKGEPFIHDLPDGDYEWSDCYYPLLSIGQMIAFLGDQKVDSKNFKGNIPVSRLICDAEANHIVIAWNDTELSNALWQAVKEVLEKHDV